MALDRRALLKTLAAGGVASVALAPSARAYTRKSAPPGAMGMLYDTTRCTASVACSALKRLLTVYNLVCRAASSFS